MLHWLAVLGFTICDSTWTRNPHNMTSVFGLVSPARGSYPSPTIQLWKWRHQKKPAKTHPVQKIFEGRRWRRPIQTSRLNRFKRQCSVCSTFRTVWTGSPRPQDVRTPNVNKLQPPPGPHKGRPRNFWLSRNSTLPANFLQIFVHFCPFRVRMCPGLC